MQQAVDRAREATGALNRAAEDLVHLEWALSGEPQGSGLLTAVEAAIAAAFQAFEVAQTFYTRRQLALAQAQKTRKTQKSE